MRQVYHKTKQWRLVQMTFKETEHPKTFTKLVNDDLPELSATLYRHGPSPSPFAVARAALKA